MAKKDFQVAKKFSLHGYSDMEFYVIVGGDKLQELAGVNFNGNQSGLGGVDEFIDGNHYAVVAFNGKKYMRPDVIAHECLHAAWGVFEFLNIKATCKNHEHLAYLMGQMVSWVEEVKKGLK